MFKLSKLVVIVCVLALAGSAFGSSTGRWFNNAAGDNDWANVGNWTDYWDTVNPVILPELGTQVMFQAGPANISTAAVGGVFQLGGGFTVNINNGGSYTGSNTAMIGHLDYGTVNVNAGAVLASPQIDVGSGTNANGVLNVYGTVNTSAIDIIGYAGYGSNANGTLEVFAGGVVNNAGRLTMGIRNGGDTGDAALIIHAGGMLTANDGYWNGFLQDAIDAGQIRAAAGDTLVATWTGIDSVTFTAVPEPITLALLGVGGLFLRRRK